MERFLELYEPVYKDLYRLAYSYLGNLQDAEDAVGDTVLKAYEHFDSLRKKEAFRAWIFQILVNQCKSCLRQRGKKTTCELLEEPSYTPEHGDRTIAMEMLSSLSEEERQIVALTVFGGFKGEEIAHILNRKHSTVRSRYRRALKKLEQSVRQEVRHEK